MGRLKVSTRVVCSHWISLVSQLTLARACRTRLAHLSTATRRSTGSLHACKTKRTGHRSRVSKCGQGPSASRGGLDSEEPTVGRFLVSYPFIGQAGKPVRLQGFENLVE